MRSPCWGREPHPALRAAARARAVRHRSGAGDGHLAVARLDAPRAPARGGVRARPAPGRAVVLRAGDRHAARRRRALSWTRRSSSADPDAGGRPQAPAASWTPSGAAGCADRPPTSSNGTTRRAAPGSRWRSGIAALLQLGDVLDVGSGDGAAASVARALLPLADLHRHQPAHDRGGAGAAGPSPHVRAQVADVHELPFADASFDAVLVFHTLTYAEHPARALAECARVLRPGGRLVLLCLDEHHQHEVTARYGERHPGFSPRAVRGMLSRAGPDGALGRGRLPRGQEAAPAGGAGHRRQAQRQRPASSATMKHPHHDSPADRSSLLQSASPSSTAPWAPPSAPTA